MLGQMVFVVGPSGAGKSELIGRVRPDIPNSQLLDLDRAELDSAQQEWKSGWGDRRWARDEERIGAAERREKGITLVDVGAGSLESEFARQYFIVRRSRMVAVMAPWEAVRERKHPHRDIANLIETEYSRARATVYSAAAATVENTSSKEVGTARLLQAIRLVIGVHA